jgi:hypothetical protein
MMANLFIWSFRVLIGCLGIGCLLGVAVLGASDPPAIIVAQTNYNFGELSETAPLSHAFIVKNASKSTLNIRDVQPG